MVNPLRVISNPLEYLFFFRFIAAIVCLCQWYVSRKQCVSKASLLGESGRHIGAF